MAVPTGLEPVISCVTGRRDNHYTKAPIFRPRHITPVNGSALLYIMDASLPVVFSDRDMPMNVL